MRAIPTINTSNLTLRAMRPEDFERYADIWADPTVVRYICGKPRSREESWRAFLTNAGHWQMTGFGQWGIEAHRTNRMVGQVGFFFAKRALGHDFDAWPEAGWVLSEDAQGKGFGREAAIAAHDWFDRVVTGPLVCLLEPAHVRSLQLAHHLGYKPLRRAEIQGETVQLMVRKAPP
ncbi:MAG: GNAT family N-acetyltransferase [Paracoccaceae bacterium]